MLKRHLLVPFAVFPLGCSSPPACHFTEKFVEEANAGCFIVENNRALFVEGKNGKLALPGGTKKAGEAPQCTAERETWEETGIQVIAQQQIYSFDNGFQLFNCKVRFVDSIEGAGRPWRFEINDIHWLAIDEFDAYLWRFPSQVDRYKEQLIATITADPAL
ncbi:MAG: NUDIX hydrolase [Cellvibrionaceae bacterium]|nr:NUDIX hydrolase [Cellvibrionaceae bacterium]